MAIVTIRLDGGGNYTSATAAFAAGAVNPGDRVSFTQAGTYANESWTGPSAPPTGITIANDSGGVVTCEDVSGRTTYFLTAPAALTLSGLTLSLTTAGAGTGIYWALQSAGGALAIEDCSIACRDTPTAAYVLIRTLGAGQTLTMRRCVVTNMQRHQMISAAGAMTVDVADYSGIMGAATPGYLWNAKTGSTGTFARCDAGAAGYVYAGGCTSGTFALDNCRSSYFLTMVAAATTGVTVTIDGCGSARTAATPGAVDIAAGCTVASLTIMGSYAANVLVRNLGTITAFAGAYNVYVTTAVGTTSAADKAVASVAEFRLGGLDGIEPLEGSALANVIPLGNPVTSETDLLGRPRLYGGRQTVGPVQQRISSQRRHTPMRAA